MKKQLASLKKLQQRRLRQAKRKPGDAERKLRSEEDKKKYAQNCKTSGKKRVSHPQSRAYKAVILGDNAEVLGTLLIKATSNNHAEKVLQVMMKQKNKEIKLTGDVREWVKQTGKQRPKKSK